jgi:hypothetical protein
MSLAHVKSEASPVTQSDAGSSVSAAICRLLKKVRTE